MLMDTMPSIFGAPAKSGVMEVENKVMVKLLSYNTDGSLTSNVSTTLMNNISEYLSDYRMLNDYITIEPAVLYDSNLIITLFSTSITPDLAGAPKIEGIVSIKTL